MMKQRDDTLDLLRLGAILLVVMIHYSNYYCRYLTDVHTISFGGAILYNGLARICVPLFFMLSGALMLGRAVEPAKLKKKVLRFFSVLVVWTIFYFVWDILFMKKEFDLESYIADMLMVYSTLKRLIDENRFTIPEDNICSWVTSIMIQKEKLGR